MTTGTRIITALLCGLLLSSLTHADTAPEAWQALVGSNLSKRPEFAYVQNDPALPNILLYGDSISIGYTQPVRERLQGKANVYRVHCNGGDAASVIPKLTAMHDTMRDPLLDDPWSFPWNVIHFNVGLHDLKYMDGGKLDKINGKQVHSTEEYTTHLEAVIGYLEQLAPEARLIFATTTPVPDGEPGRVAGDAARFNEAARNVLKRHPEIQVNDLFRFTKPRQPEWWTRPGNVHFNPVGRSAQGNEVARVLLQALSAETGSELAPKDWTVNGITRTALIHAPSSAHTSSRPVVFAFHGHGGTMHHAARIFRYHQVWPEALVVYMQGLATPGKFDPDGKKPGWQNRAGIQQDRDLQFFDQVLSFLKEEYPVDEKRIYATGHSNGGGFTYLLWAERGSVLAAVAPSAAGAWPSRDRQPLPALHLAGEQDNIVPYANQMRTMKWMRKTNQCAAEGTPWARADHLTGTFYPSRDDTPFIALIHPGGHKFPAGAPDLIVQFFKAHSRP